MLKFAWMQYVSILVVFYVGFQGICMLIYPSQVCPRVVVGWVELRLLLIFIMYCMYSGADTVSMVQMSILATVQTTPHQMTYTTLDMQYYTLAHHIINTTSQMFSTDVDIDSTFRGPKQHYF